MKIHQSWYRSLDLRSQHRWSRFHLKNKNVFTPFPVTLIGCFVGLLSERWSSIRTASVGGDTWYDYGNVDFIRYRKAHTIAWGNWIRHKTVCTTASGPAWWCESRLMVALQTAIRICYWTFVLFGKTFDVSFFAKNRRVHTWEAFMTCFVYSAPLMCKARPITARYLVFNSVCWYNIYNIKSMYILFNTV